MHMWICFVKMNYKIGYIVFSIFLCHEVVCINSPLFDGRLSRYLGVVSSSCEVNFLMSESQFSHALS